jgi:hypothetical protein
MRDFAGKSRFHSHEIKLKYFFSRNQPKKRGSGLLFGRFGNNNDFTWQKITSNINKHELGITFFAVRGSKSGRVLQSLLLNN